MAFEGWLIKFGGEIFPVNYIAPSSYRATPECGVVFDEYEDANGKGYRDVSMRKKSEIRFSTKLGLHQKDIEEIQRIIKNGIINESQRLCAVSFWSPKSSEYRTEEMWVEDIEYPMRKVDPDKKDIIYDNIEIILTGR